LRVDHVRQQVERQVADEDRAEHEDHGGEHRRPDGAADGPACDAGPAMACPAARAVVGAARAGGIVGLACPEAVGRVCHGLTPTVRPAPSAGRRLSLGATAMRTVEPSRSMVLPATTTVSPAASPLVIST